MQSAPLLAGLGDDASEFTGLPAYLTPDQEVAYATAGTLRLGLTELETRCHPSDGDFGAGPDVFVMSSRARARLLNELEELGVEPSYKPCDLLGGRMVLHYHGIPVITGRVREGSLPSEATVTTEAWALKLTGPTGVRVVHLGGNSSSYRRPGVKTTHPVMP